MKSITTESAPNPLGHYSQAIVYNGLVFVSGQIPIDPATGDHITGPIQDQTAQVLRNISAILEEAGSSMGHVLKSNIFVPDISLWDGVNEIYSSFFGDHRPARIVIPSRDLHHGFLIEMDVIAALASD